MKKLLISLMIAGLLMFGSGNANAGWGIPIGNVDEAVVVGNSDHSLAFDGSWSNPTGIAVGIGSISGEAEGAACGIMINGTISGTVIVNGGGNSQSYALPGGVGTRTDNLAVASADLDLAANGFFGIGGVAGDAFGSAEQCSLNTSFGIANGGFTDGLATQESAGGFGGDAAAGVFLFGNTTAGFDASIVMNGGSGTLSYKTADGLGTSVAANTTVTTTGNSYGTGCLAGANVDGGFNASGSVNSFTVQNVNGGNASASANGSYSGAASLGATYNGSASGYTETAAYSNGVMSAGASMTVTSTLRPTVD